MRFVVQLSWGGGDIDNQDFPKGAFDNVDKDKTPDQLKNLFQRNIMAGGDRAQVDAAPIDRRELMGWVFHHLVIII
jgi:hypothetical protein